MPAPISHDEEDRLKELLKYGLLDTPPEQAYDRITSLAARIFKVSTALMVLVDRDRQWFKSRYGLKDDWSEREDSFCTYTILEDRPMVVRDARVDSRFADNVHVAGEPHYRFYAGVPLTTANGYRVGTLCVLDEAPRPDFAEHETAILRDLAAMVREEMELRVQQRPADPTQTHPALYAAEAKYRGIFENATEGIYQTLPDGTLPSANPSLARLLGYDTPQNMLEAVTVFDSHYAQPGRRAEFQRQVDAEGFVKGFVSEVRRADGGHLWISENARAIRGVGGELLYYEGTIEDVSARRAAEEGLRQLHEELESRVRTRTGELALVNGDLRLLLHEREAAEGALRQSEARFRAMIENAQDLITILGPDGTMLYHSPSVTPIFGYQPEELVGQSVFGQLHPEDHALVQERLESIFVHGQTHVRAEARLRHRDGSWRLIDSVASRPPAGSPIAGLVVNSRDITERRRAEQSHDARTRQQTALGELSRFALDGPDVQAIFEKAVVLTTEALGIRMVTITELLPGKSHLIIRAESGFAPGTVGKATVESWRHARGYPPDHREPVTIEDFADEPDCRFMLRESMEEQPRSAVSVVIQGIEHPFGTLCAMSSTAGRFGGQDVTFLQTIADLLSTAIQRRRHEEALELVEKRHQRIVANTPGMVYQSMVRADGSFAMLFVSEECRMIYGVEPRAFYERPELFWETAAPDDRQSLIMAGSISLSRLEPMDWEGRIEPPAGGITHVSIRSRPERLANGDTIWDGVVIDVSDTKRVEAAMLAAKEEAERANNAKSEFLSRISHELRTPLNAILGFGQLLEMDVLTSAQQSSVEQILRGGRQLLNLINEVLDIARIDSGNMEMQFEPVSVCELLGATVRLVEPLARDRRVSFDPVPARYQCSEVLADRDRVSQVLINLLSNAIKYNSEGGRVSFGCGKVENGSWRHTITDTGPGMTPEAVSRLFTPFERLDAPRRGIEGTGLGLAISRSLIEAMGGTLGVISEPGKGSTFFIELPIAPARTLSRTSATWALEGPSPDPLPTAGRQRTVLHVEALRGNRELVELALMSRPQVRLLECRDGEAGLMRARIGRIDLILLDLHLPDMSAEEFLGRLRAVPLAASTPVIVLSNDTGGGSQVERLRGFGVGASLVKPLEPSQLLSEIDRVLSTADV